MTYKTVTVCALLLGGAVIWGRLNAEPPATSAPSKEPAAAKKPGPAMGGMGGGHSAGTLVPPARHHKPPKEGYKTWTGPAWVSTLPTAEQEFARRVNKSLQQTVSLDFQDKPLEDVATEIAQTLGVNVLFDVKSLEELKIVPAETTVTFQVSKVTVDAALNEVLASVDESLTWILRDQALLITTKTKADAQENFEVRVYPVRDLVSVDADAGDANADFDSLIDLITSTVAPDTWGDAPGQGAIKAFENSESLTVSHTRRTQDEIVRLLTGLRVAQAMLDGNEKVLGQLQGDKTAGAPADAARKNPPPASEQKPNDDR